MKNISEMLCDIDDQVLCISVGEMTPKEAESILGGRNAKNRALSNNSVNLLAEEMREGTFRFNGDAIRFDSDGNLIDGQHRLWGIVRSGVASPVMVISGLDSSVKDTLDRGKPRSVVDMLTYSGDVVPNMTTTVATASILMLGDRSSYSAGRNKSAVANFVRDNKDWMGPVVSWSNTVAKTSPITDIKQYSRRHCMSPAPLAGLLSTMETAGAHADSIRSFFEKIAEIIPTDAAEFISYKWIRRFLVTNYPLIREGGTQFPRMMQVYETLICAYNKVGRGEEIKQVRLLQPVDSIRFFDQLTTPTSAVSF